MISTSPPRLYFPSTRYEFQFVPPSAQLSSDENPFVSFVRPLFSPAIVQAPRYYAKHNNYFRCVLSPSLVNPLVIDILEFSPTGCFCALYLQKGMGSLTTTLSNVDSSALEHGCILCGVDDALLGISMTRSGTRLLAGSIFNRRCVAYRRRHEPPAVPNRVVWSTRDCSVGGADTPHALYNGMQFENPRLRLINTRAE